MNYVCLFVCLFVFFTHVCYIDVLHQNVLLFVVVVVVVCCEKERKHFCSFSNDCYSSLFVCRMLHWILDSKIKHHTLGLLQLLSPLQFWLSSLLLLSCATADLSGCCKSISITHLYIYIYILFHEEKT